MALARQHGGSAEILAFPGQRAPRHAPTARRFSLRDRIVALNWAETVFASGFARMVFEQPADGCGAEDGEFLLVYGRNSGWASWGIGCAEDGLMLWKSACGTTVGTFATLAEALDRLAALRSPI